LFAAAPVILVCGLVLSACTAETTGNIQRALNDIDRQFPTDCSSYVELAETRLSSLPEADRLKIRTRLRYHYSSLNPRVMHAEARQILMTSSKSFGEEWARTEGVVSKFIVEDINVFIHSNDPLNIGQSRRAIQKINDALRVHTHVQLQPHFISPNSATPPNRWAEEKGIHLYFGSEGCMWKVFDEQAGVSKEDIAPSATFNFKNLGGITLTQELVLDGIKTGRLQRSLVVILNLPDPVFKQNVIEHELMHALGVKGHTRSILWSRMSQETGSVAPLPFLSSFDRQILKLLYSKLSAGDSAARVTEVLEKEWESTDIRAMIDADKCLDDVGRRQNDGETIEGVELLTSIVCDMGIRITKRN
jgi:hypothetical protein